jgi:predicted transcriptional regulator
VKFLTEQIASEFFEVGSEQRLSIILHLNEKAWSISRLAKELEATITEVHRNFVRLQKAGLILKNVDGTYHLTLFGKNICSQVPAHQFLNDNKKYFETHDFGDLPQKFFLRIGCLSDSKLISGYTKVSEKWKSIYSNANEYIKNILVDIPYSSDLMEILISKLNKGISINSIFTETAIIPEERKTNLPKFNLKKFIEQEMLKRKMIKSVKVVVVLNEKEAGISFPTTNGEVDLSKMIYGSTPEFHEWCFDYFKHYWELASSFQESKLEQ